MDISTQFPRFSDLLASTVRRIRCFRRWVAVLAVAGGWVPWLGINRAEAALSPTVQVLLTWDANTEEDLAGYRVMHGEASGQYTATLDVGLVTEVVLPGMRAGTTYFFVVAAYNTAGEEGPPSDEIQFTPTLVAPSFVMEPLPGPPPGDPALTASRASISGWKAVGSGGFGFQVSANPGQPLQIFASHDMLNWELLGAYDNPTGRFQVLDYAGGLNEMRYYQVVPAPGWSP